MHPVAGARHASFLITATIQGQSNERTKLLSGMGLARPQGQLPRVLVSLSSFSVVPIFCLARNKSLPSPNLRESLFWKTMVSNSNNKHGRRIRKKTKWDAEKRQ